MIHLQLDGGPDKALRVLCLGAHSDDIEIGCGGTILRLAEQYPGAVFHWVVFSAIGIRETEAKRAATMFVDPGNLEGPLLKTFPDGFMPFVGAEVKAVFEDLKAISPDLIFTHNRKDAHQDHRTIGEIVPTVFRDALYLAYEIPKWDGDLGRPSLYVPLSETEARRKVELLHKCYPSQRGRDWWDDEVFLGLARLRGMECRARYAEAFSCAKSLLLPTARHDTGGTPK